MIREIIQIDEDKCNGCGLCAAACHEGAIQMIGGKARLVKESYCDGLGDCLPACPMGAIGKMEREAEAYDAAAVSRWQATLASVASADAAGAKAAWNAGRGCPGAAARQLCSSPTAEAPADGKASLAAACPSALRQWPVQLRLAPIKSPAYDHAPLLLAADCAAYAYGRFHDDFMRGHGVLIACPKLDPVDYREKLTAILRQNEISGLHVVRMEVPCCGGLVAAAKEALLASGRQAQWKVTTLSCTGAVCGASS